MPAGFPHYLPTHYRVPAEWEPQQAVSIATPPGEEFDPSQFVGRPNTTVEAVHGSMVKGLLGHTKVRLLAQNEKEGRDYAKAIGADGLSEDAFEIVAIAHGDIWVRDTGPIWGRNEHGELGIVWMGFDNWGYFPRITGDWATCDIPNYLPRDLGAALGIPVFRTPLIAEGGDKSFNGKGSLICCKAVECQRNPELSFPELEELLRRSFAIQHIVWTERGLADDDQTFDVHRWNEGATLPGGVFTPLCTGGHVDEYCRFVGPRTVLLAEVHASRHGRMSPIEEITHVRMEENFRLLSQQRDQDGNPLKIIRMPLPVEQIYRADQRDPVWYTMRDLRGVKIERTIKVVLAASYCNFLVSNGVVLFPCYFAPGMNEEVDVIDRAAQAVIRQAFPDHKIVLIDPVPVNAGGGGMHCISNDQPTAGR